MRFLQNVKLSNKGQLKIQEMAFVLVALMILFSIAMLFYFSIRYNDLKQTSEDLREQEVIETIRKISGTPEFSWAAEDCASCVDFDKALMLKERVSYQGFWKNIALLQVTRVYPIYEDDECTRENYPECNTITIVKEEGNYQGHGAFTAICMFEENEQYSKCEVGKVVMAFTTVQ